MSELKTRVNTGPYCLKIDTRETELWTQIQSLQTVMPGIDTIQITKCPLPLGDLVISRTDNDQDVIIIERKTVADLLASIKDGRYEEQSFRLSGIASCHNHNVIYLIEGNIRHHQHFKKVMTTEHTTAYSALFSLNYYKGFSVMRTLDIAETAYMVCNMVLKLTREHRKKDAYYANVPKMTTEPSNEQHTDTTEDPENTEYTDNTKVKEDEDNTDDKEGTKEGGGSSGYATVVKKVKKDNITRENIGEIMLSQIPGVSTVTAAALIAQFGSLPQLVHAIAQNPEALKGVSYTNPKGQVRKLNKTTLAHITAFLT